MKIKRFLQGIPRPVMACLHVALVCVLFFMFYMAIRCYPFTLRQDFRRAERANLVGPSKIVDQFKPWDLQENLNLATIITYDDVIIGETEHGICFFQRRDIDLGGWYDSASSFRKQFIISSDINLQEEYIGEINPSIYDRQFYYIEKTGNITVVTIPTRSPYDYSDTDEVRCFLPLYVFTEYKDAASAQITLTIVDNTEFYDETIDFSEVFTAEATAIDSGVLRCFLESSGGSSNAALEELVWLTYVSCFPKTQELSIPCTVSLYDADGNLIVQEELDLFSSREK